MKFNKKKLTAFIAVVTVLTIMVGSFAFFTDRVQTKASVTTADASDIIRVNPDPETYPEDIPDDKYDPAEILEAKWERNNKDRDEFVAPGDMIDLSYTLKNIGTADIDVKETIVLTVKDSKGQPLNLTNATTPEWQLFADSTQNGNGAYIGGTKITVEKVEGNKITYTRTGFTLAKGATAAQGGSLARDYELILNMYTGNAFQGSVCTVDYLVEVRQHVDGMGADERWDEFRSDKITFAAQENYKVVPAA